MTIIAWDHVNQIMAADSKVSCGETFDSTARKIERLPNGGLLGSAGDTDTRDVYNLIKDVTIRNLPSRDKLILTKCDYEGILVFKNGRAFYIWIGQSEKKHNEWAASVTECKGRKFFCAGSGANFCLGTLAAGASVIKAVNLTCQWINSCGGPIQIEYLKPNKKTI